MKNPYKILGISQNATSQDIIRAVALAMRKRACSTREIAEARAVLSKPASRLAADFTFPIFPKHDNLISIKAKLKATDLTVGSLSPDKYDSL